MALTMLPRQAFRAATRSTQSVTPHTRCARDYSQRTKTCTLFQTTSATSALRQRSFPRSAGRRFAATGVLPGQKKSRGPISRFLHRTATYIGVFALATGTLIGAFFVYDYTTYRDDLSSGDIPVSELALNPRIGGPKNLPIVDHFIDDDESQQARDCKHKPKLVVLGTGWGSVALLKNLNPDDYHVVVISPSNYFLFTPMLPSATVGTLELRSLVEPIRRILPRIKGHFMKGSAEDVDFSLKLVEVSALDTDGTEQRFYVPYDKLIVGVGKLQARLAKMKLRLMAL
jgi:NADH dehydrogenase